MNSRVYHLVHIGAIFGRKFRSVRCVITEKIANICCSLVEIVRNVRQDIVQSSQSRKPYRNLRHDRLTLQIKDNHQVVIPAPSRSLFKVSIYS